MSNRKLKKQAIALACRMEGILIGNFTRGHRCTLRELPEFSWDILHDLAHAGYVGLDNNKPNPFVEVCQPLVDLYKGYQEGLSKKTYFLLGILVTIAAGGAGVLFWPQVGKAVLGFECTVTPPTIPYSADY